MQDIIYYKGRGVAAFSAFVWIGINKLLCSLEVNGACV